MLLIMENPTRLLFEVIRFCESHSDFVRQVRLLLKRGADPNAHCTDGQTLLIYMLYVWGLYGEPRINPDQFLEAARLLIAHGTDVRKSDISGRTALTYVVENGFSHWHTLVQELQEAGATVGVMEASMMGDAATLETLLKQGASPDASVKVDCHIFTKYSLYAIHFAAWRGHAECVRLLLNYGANPDYWNNIGLIGATALGCAVSTNRPDILEMLLQSGAVMKPFYGRTLLIESVEKGFTEVARILLKYGGDVNGHGIGSAVRDAAKLGHADVMRLLLEEPQNVSKNRWKLHEALWTAAYEDHTEVVSLLLEQRTETHRRRQGKTPLEIAATQGHTRIVELLSAPG